MRLNSNLNDLKKKKKIYKELLKGEIVFSKPIDASSKKKKPHWCVCNLENLPIKRKLFWRFRKNKWDLNDQPAHSHGNDKPLEMNVVSSTITASPVQIHSLSLSLS